MKVSIFRVEHCRGGAGPYRGNKSLATMHAAHAVGNHPNPAQDSGLTNIMPDEYCGFATLDALAEWFAGYEQLLADAGFVIAEYLMPLNKVRYGQTQALFRRGDYWPVRTMPLTRMP